MGSLINLFTTLGWSRDDWKWTYGQIVSIAALVTSGVFDVQHWLEYVGLHPTVTEIHIVQVVALIILWLSGKMDSSHLPSKQAAAEIKATTDTAVAKAAATDAAPAADPRVVNPPVDPAPKP